MSGVRLASVISASCEALLPCLCLHCGGTIGGDQVGLCGSCWSAVVPRAGSSCPRCASPADETAELCLACQDDPPAYSGAVAWGEYDGALRSAVLGLKARGRDELAASLGRRLAARVSLEEWAADIDRVVAVPSHPLRRLRRGWPAAALLADVVGRELAVPLRPLLRRRGMARQTGRSRAERSRLPRRTFHARGRLAGCTVLLVDDVTTTGTTLRRAAEVLLAAGVGAVYCAAMAVTPDGRSMT
jgi:ComF family protein